MFYEAWKHDNFTASNAAQVLSSEGIAAFFLARLPCLFLRLHARLWLLFGCGGPR